MGSERELALKFSPHDTLRQGFSCTSESLTTTPHPVEAAVTATNTNKVFSPESDFIHEMACQFGLGQAMTFRADQLRMSKYHRLPGLESSFLGLEVVNGRDMTVGYEDFLGDRELSTEHFQNLHQTMERHLGF